MKITDYKGCSTQPKFDTFITQSLWTFRRIISLNARRDLMSSSKHFLPEFKKTRSMEALTCRALLDRLPLSGSRSACSSYADLLMKVLECLYNLERIG